MAVRRRHRPGRRAVKAAEGLLAGVFVAFAIEYERQRDFLKGQWLHPRAPYEFVDMSVKEPYDSGWKDHVRTRIRRSHSP